ncbi:MAG: FAD-dependent oxidoreductase [Evtepia sp.]|uniref:FAD-dependent oxidoreductase n=1 Tax=Evtepia sp. TaxID=2773933 RepID=UPI002A761724|nr:FAD-dependent oxidoreductase [Evtepia sp.]MDY3014859.1 FAD-dependent oxidoreductase [Evtepia sp.]
MKEKIRVTINGQRCTGTPGQTLLEIAQNNGIEIPNLCHNSELKHYGGCSLCVVEAEGSPKLLRACSTVATDGQVIYTESERVVRTGKISMELLMSDHDGDCRGPCVMHCPANVNVQDYVQAIARGEDREAVRIIKENLPIPASIGRVCPHPCEGGCRRAMVEEAISISYLKYFAADRVIKEGGYLPAKKAATGKRIGIVGGGPGGLTAAYYLSLMGHRVTIVDAMPKMGGMLRYGIPEYRLPKKVLDEEVAEIASLGVEMKNNFRIGQQETFEEFKSHYDAVILAIGAWESMPMGCPGEELKGVMGGIDFLRQVALGGRPDIGDKVAVVGGGNTAMDACRTAVRLGAKEVYVVYRRTEKEMPAEQLEIDEAREEGVVFKFLTNPAEIIGENGQVTAMKLQVMELGEPDESGRRRPVPVPGKFETLPVTCVIGAIGQKANVKGFETVELNRKGIIAADETSYRTSLEGVFAVGDATNNGASIAIEAIGEARRCAKVVDLYLQGLDIPYRRTYRSEKEVTPETFADYIKLPRAQMPTRPAEERRNDFGEINLGFSEAQARAEAARCLDCGCHDYNDCKLIRCANLYEIHPERLKGKKHESFKEKRLVAIERDQGKCILCGQCVRICEEVVGKGIIDLIGRGFETTIRPEFQTSYAVRGCLDCLKCAQACPTGALRIRENEQVEEA